MIEPWSFRCEFQVPSGVPECGILLLDYTKETNSKEDQEFDQAPKPIRITPRKSLHLNSEAVLSLSHCSLFFSLKFQHSFSSPINFSFFYVSLPVFFLSLLLSSSLPPYLFPHFPLSSLYSFPHISPPSLFSLPLPLSFFLSHSSTFLSPFFIPLSFSPQIYIPCDIPPALLWALPSSKRRWRFMYSIDVIAFPCSRIEMSIF